MVDKELYPRQSSHRLTQWLLLSCVAFVSLMTPTTGLCDEEKEPAPEPPKIMMTLPLAISSGETKSLTLRGLKLDRATTVQILPADRGVMVNIRKKEASAVPDKLEAKDVGDSLVEVDFVLPADFTADTLPFTVTNPDGTSMPFSVRVIPADKLAIEVEPNDSLRKPQNLPLGIAVSGTISQPKDVDVYEFAGLANQSFAAEVIAAQLGSPCDAQLTLFNSAGQILAISDDSPNGRDAVLRIVLPRDDTYRLTLLDATDRGSSLHVYLLNLRVE